MVLPVADRKTYVLDTSVLLSDPWAYLRFDGHNVVIPLIVISELEGKRHHSELGWFAREALRGFEKLRLRFGALSEPIPLEHGGTFRVELNHIDQTILPDGFRGNNDARILSCALHFHKEKVEKSGSHNVCLVSKDIPLRVKAGAVGLATEEYRGLDVVTTEYSGMTEKNVRGEDIDRLYRDGVIDIPVDWEIATHCGVRLLGESSSALARATPNKQLKIVRGDKEMFGIRGRSAEQRIAIDLLLDESIGIISLGGKAGTGKSALALCAGLEAVLERNSHKKIVVFRPLYAVGEQELGYLPGTASEKMNPWSQAVFDTLESLVSPEVIEEVLAREMLEVLPLTHIRGRSLHDSFVIVDEAQSLERNVLLTVLSRLGNGSRVVLTHDVAQRDNLRVGRHDGVVAVVEKLRGHPLFAHLTLVRSERSPIAALVTELLEETLQY